MKLSQLPYVTHYQYQCQHPTLPLGGGTDTPPLYVSSFVKVLRGPYDSCHFPVDSPGLWQPNHTTLVNLALPTLLGHLEDLKSVSSFHCLDSTLLRDLYRHQPLKYQQLCRQYLETLPDSRLLRILDDLVQTELEMGETYHDVTYSFYYLRHGILTPDNLQFLSFDDWCLWAQSYGLSPPTDQYQLGDLPTQIFQQEKSILEWAVQWFSMDLVTPPPVRSLTQHLWTQLMEIPFPFPSSEMTLSEPDLFQMDEDLFSKSSAPELSEEHPVSWCSEGSLNEVSLMTSTTSLPPVVFVPPHLLVSKNSYSPPDRQLTSRFSI